MFIAMRSFAVLCTVVMAMLTAAMTSAEAADNTTLKIYNGSNLGEVPVTITVPAGSVCGAGSIANMRVENNGTNIPITQINGLQGWFKLGRGQTVTLKNTQTECLGGVNIAFLSPPQCPCTSGCAGFVPFVPGPNVPNGVCQAEVTLNPPGDNQEAVNISCNTGSNATIRMASNDGGPKWGLPDGTFVQKFNIQNSWVDIAGQRDNNCNLLGVLAYQLSTCNAGPASCPGAGPFCSTSNPKECILQRSRSDGHFGGIVTVTFVGALSPPN